MKTIQNLAALLIISAVLVAPRLASAGTTFTLAVSPTSDTALQGLATNITYPANPTGVKATATSGYTGGGVTLSYTVAYSGGASATPGITVGFSPNPTASGLTSSGVFSALSVSTVSGTLAGTYTVTINGINTASPAKTASTTYTLIVGTGVASSGPAMVWNGSVNTSWANGSNWTPAGPPVLTNDVDFFDAGAAGSAGAVDNIVGASLTIGSLNYGQTNSFHTTQISPGVGLTVGGDTNGLSAGTGTDNGSTQNTLNTITGVGGSLLVTNTSASVNVVQSCISIGTANATLDMSGLGTFYATISRMLVGVDSAIRGANGTVNLALTNVIRMTPGSAAPQLDVGDNSQASAITGGVLDTLLLGQTNTFYVDSIEVGRGKTLHSTMLFNSALISPAAYFRGTNTTGRVGTWSIGDANAAKGATCSGTNDFSGGSVDALVDQMHIGTSSSASSGGTPGTGTLTFGAGTINVNTLQLGDTVLPANGAVGQGTVNANGGTLLVNTLVQLAVGGGSSGTLNITGAAVTASGGIVAGGGNSTINLNSGTLTVTNGNSTIGTSASPLSALNTAGGTLNLALQSLIPSIVTTNITTTGTTTINLSSVPILTGFPAEFPIIAYQNPALGGTFNLGTLPSGSPAYGAYLTNDASINAIAIVFTNGPSIPALTWDGTLGGNWNLSSANWRPKTGPDMAYAQGDFVTFDDSLTGTPNVNLTTALTPATLTVTNAAANYVFSGTGSLGGSMTLVKNGSGTLTLGETGGDNFSGGLFVINGTLVLDNANGAITGGTTINGGTVQVGNNDNLGLPSLGNVTDSGTLIFEQNNNAVMSNSISGSGVVIQNSALQNILTLSGNNTFSGTATVLSGTLQVGSSNTLTQVPGVTVTNAATFDVDGVTLFGNGNTNLLITVSGAGVGGNGAIVNTGASQTGVLHKVTLAADVTFGGNGDWDIRNSSGSSRPADGQLNGAFNLTKVGTNTVTLKGVTVDPLLGNINVQQGAITFTATASAPITSLGDPTMTITVFSNATLTLDTIGSIPSKNFILNNSGTLKSSSTNTFANPLTLTGAANNTITVGGGSQFTITTAINGSGGFSKNGSGPLFLSANNTYIGNTVVSGGTLALYGGGADGSISTSTNINLNAGSTIDASGRSDGTFTLASGQTLTGGVSTSGAGFINGIFIANAGAFFAPGTGTTNLGTITVSSNAMLAGATKIKLNAATGANDQLAAYALAYGGTLTVTNVSGTFTNGQTFQVFVASNGVYNAAAFSSVTLPSATGLTWTNNLAVNGTLTAGVVSGPVVSPGITSINLSGTTLVISGTNGTPGQQYEVLTSTNLTLPRTNWVSIATNTFGSMNFSVTNTVNPGSPQSFYLLRVP